MKLAEILARDLAEWPEGAEALTQGFAGMVFYVTAEIEVVKILRTERASDWRNTYVTRAEWQAARKL